VLKGISLLKILLHVLEEADRVTKFKEEKTAIESKVDVLI